MEVIHALRLSQESTREYVYRFLKINIMNFKLAPGTALSEQDIANRLEVSRTPVREAFIQLSQEGLLDILPQKGTYVSFIDIDNVEEAKFLRETMDTAVIKIACTEFAAEKMFELQSNIMLQKLCLSENNHAKFFELNEAFHQTIFIGCKKARIWTLTQQMQAHYNRVRILNQSRFDLSAVLHQHKELVRAIQEKNVGLGIRTISSHLNLVNIDIKNIKKNYGPYFK
jgi:GntR family transcriptional regulator, rspAB operon transcriptional repressor